MSGEQCIKYKEWVDNYNWETCITNRKNYADFLINYLTSKKGKFVLNLNGVWGTGKTEFLKRVYVDLAEKNYPVVYIDAWESDFLNNPLNVICTEILTQLGWMFLQHEQTKYEKISESIKNLLTSFDNIAKITSVPLKAYNYISNDEIPNIEMDFLKDIYNIISEKNFLNDNKDVNQNNNKLLNELIIDQVTLVSSMKAIRKQITSISEIMNNVYDLNLPIVVLVDELDRCRPTYAIKMLEIVKHFFETEGCVFLIASDTASLEKSITTVYGNGFNSSKYLNRFFHQRIKLKKPSILEYVKLKNIDYKKHDSDSFLSVPFFNEKVHYDTLFSAMLSGRSLELRDIEQIFEKYEAALSYVESYRPKGAGLVNIAVLFYGIIENHVEFKEFDDRTNNYTGNYNIRGGNFYDISMNEYMNLMFSSVTKKLTNQTYDINGARRTTTKDIDVLALKSIRITLPIKNTSITQDKAYLRVILDTYDYLPDKFLLWEDYKNLIGLTEAIGD